MRCNAHALTQRNVGGQLGRGEEQRGGVDELLQRGIIHVHPLAHRLATVASQQAMHVPGNLNAGQSCARVTTYPLPSPPSIPPTRLSTAGGANLQARTAASAAFLQAAGSQRRIMYHRDRRRQWRMPPCPAGAASNDAPLLHGDMDSPVATLQAVTAEVAASRLPDPLYELADAAALATAPVAEGQAAAAAASAVAPDAGSPAGKYLYEGRCTP